MSEFRLSEVAGWIGKDERTLRRWCIAGRVSGAFQTAGGHWRIRAESANRVRVDHDGFQTRRRGRWKTSHDLLRRLRSFHARGRGRALETAAKAVVENVDILVLTRDDRERLKAALVEVLNQPLALAGAPDLVKRVAVGIWEQECNRQGWRGEKGAARVAGIPRTTFRLYFSRYLSRRIVADVEPEPCDYPEHATDREKNAMRLAALHHAGFED